MKSIKAEMKIKYKGIKIKNSKYKGRNENQIYYKFQSNDEIERIETSVPNKLIVLNSIRKLKEGGPKCNINIQLISIEGPNRTKSKLK